MYKIPQEVILLEINQEYIIYIRDYQPYLLGRPRKKEDKAETLEELGIVTVETELWSSSI